MKTKPHVLFVTEKWRDARPGSPPTNNEHNLFGSLEATGFATFSFLHFDEYFWTHRTSCDAELTRLVNEQKPDMTVFCLIPWFKQIPAAVTVANISKLTKCVFVWPDAVWDGHVALADQYEPYSALSILWDVDIEWKPRKKYVHLWTPQDPRIYHDPGLERIIDVCFVGSSSYQERQMYLNHLQNVGIDVYTAGGQGKRLDVHEYVKIFQRSKISLNFCMTNQWVGQLKGRIFESMFCGAMLMESRYETNWIDRWFIPNVHYVPFHTTNELADGIKYYLDHDDERQRIAQNGHRRCVEWYSNVAWWHYVFKESGVNITP